MPNKRKDSKEGISIAIERELKEKWKSEAEKMGLTLSDYIIYKVSTSFEQITKNDGNKNSNSRKSSPHD